MAAMDDNPTVKEGQSWSSWADIVGFRNSENEEEEEDAAKEKNWKKRRENDAMKLRKEEMGLFGYCPTWDDFFLVVCELCGRVVKPQAFSGHLEYRHGTSSHSNRESASSNPQPQHHHHGKNSSGNGGASSGQEPNAPSSSQNRVGSSSMPLISNRSSAPSSGSLYSNQVVLGGAKSSSTLSNSQLSSSSNSSKLSATKLGRSHLVSSSNNNNNDGNNTPNSLVNNSGASNNGKSSKTSESKQKKNHSIDPVVRVERMPSSVVMKKTTGSPSSVHSGDNKRDLTSSPLIVPNVSPNSSYAPLPQNLCDEVNFMHDSPGAQVLYEGTSGPGPGGSGYSSVALENPIQVTHNNSYPRKIAPSPKPAVLDAVKKNSSVSGEVHRNVTSSIPINRKPNKSKKASKERKLPLCKDREYDANKHCGVLVAESGKPCTRSLTCKTHSLSLRRAVIGRKKHFDELLSDHRAAKEALQKAAQANSQGNTSGSGCSNNQGCSSNIPDVQGSSALKLGQGSNNQSHRQTIATLQRVLISGRGVSKLGVRGASKPTHHSASSSTSTSVLTTPSQNHSLQRVSGSKVTSDSLNLESNTSYSLDPGKSPSSDSATKNQSVQRSDLPYTTHHPRPAAMCSFGVRRMGSGIFLANRYHDAVRSALEMAFFHEKGAQVPPPKKVCSEAGLLALHESAETSDPYNFTCLDLSGVNESNDSDGSLAASPTYTNLKPSNTNSNLATNAASVKGNQFLPNNKLSSGIVATSQNSSVFVSHNSVLTSARMSTDTVNSASAVKRTSKSKLTNAVNKLKRIKNSSVDSKSDNAETNCESSVPLTASAAKKRRTNSGANAPTTGNTNPSNSAVPTTQTMSNRQTGSNPQTVTLTALSSTGLYSSGGNMGQNARSLPLSFPLTIGERLGALSRLQVSSPFVNRNSLTLTSAVLRNPGTTVVNNNSVLASSGVPNHVTSSSLKDSVFLTGVDVINGQLPVTTALLHSVTVSRASDTMSPTLLATPATGGLGITLAPPATGLVNQISRFQQKLTSNKPIEISSGLSGAKGTKCKSKKNSGRSNNTVGAQSVATNRTFSSNLGLSLLLDGGPGAISNTHGSSCGGIQISSGSSPTSCPSPQMRMGSLSPGVNSPNLNGRGPASPQSNLPPHFTSSKNVFGSSGATVMSSGTPISGTNVRLSPASRTSTPSPDSLQSSNSFSNTSKGKSRHSSSFQKPVPTLNMAVAQHHGNLAFPVTPPLNISALPVGTTSSPQPITYQQVFASQMLTQAQFNQLQQFHSPATVPSKNNKSVSKKGNTVTATQQLSLNASPLPLKQPLLASLGGIASATSAGQQHRHLLLGDDSRRKDLQQDSHSLST